MALLEKELVIRNKFGLHARPAAQLVQTANQFDAEILISKGDVKINAKSIMGVLMLAAAQGAALKIIADGPDAADAIEHIERLLAAGFGEE